MTNITKIATKIKNEDDSETEPDDLTAKIVWKSYETRIIDLKVMCETDVDKYSMILSEVPTSTQFSIPKNLFQVHFS